MRIKNDQIQKISDKVDPYSSKNSIKTMGLFRTVAVVIMGVVIAACSSDGVRGKNSVPVSAHSGETSVIGMYVEQENWQCETASCAPQKRLYNEDFSDFVVVAGDFRERDIDRVLEVVGTMSEGVLNARKYERRSLMDYKAVLNEGADQHMQQSYGCVLAWNRSYQWKYSRDGNSATLNLKLEFPLSDSPDRPTLILSFDGYSGVFRNEDRRNVNGTLCQTS